MNYKDYISEITEKEKKEINKFLSDVLQKKYEKNRLTGKVFC